MFSKVRVSWLSNLEVQTCEALGCPTRLSLVGEANGGRREGEEDLGVIELMNQSRDQLNKLYC